MSLTEKLLNKNYASAAQRALARPRPIILVAEDSDDAREVMELLLESKGYQVVSVGDGLQAIKTAVAVVPDLVLIDLDLPRVDGLRVARSLRNDSGLDRVPIVVVSGHDPSRYRQAALDAGCDEYILKPINFDRLYELIENLRHRRTLRPKLL
jgi:DNA-binding response OmpR family regulator